MAFDFAQVKVSARQALHSALAVSATYQDQTMGTPVAIKCRHHTKLARIGDLENDGYAEVVEGVDRLVFLASEARALNIKRGGVVVIASYGLSFKLGERLPNTGPVLEIWEVA